MRKLAGAFFLLICGWGGGFWSAARCRSRLNRLELLDSYLACLSEELEYTAAPLCRIAKELARRPAFVRFPFARRCADAREGEPFALVFAGAVQAFFSGAEAEAPAILAGQLGVLPVSEQLAAIDRCRGRLQQLLEQKRAETGRSAELCRRLGVLAGTAAAVLLW